MSQEFIQLIVRTNQGNPSPGGLAHLRQTLSGIPKLKGDSNVLEIGINTGSSFIALSEMLPHCNLFGIDIDERMIELARRNYADVADLLDLPLSNKIEQADAKQLPFENETFDLVVSGGTLSFIDDREAAVREVYRVLKPAGFFISIEYFSEKINDSTSKKASAILGFDVNKTTLQYWTKIHSTASFSFEGIQVMKPFIHRAFEPGAKVNMVIANSQRLGVEVTSEDIDKITEVLSVFREREADVGIVSLTLRKLEDTKLIADAAN